MEKLLVHYQNVFNKHLNNYLEQYDCDTEPIMEAVNYSVRNGGKRVRPALAYMVAEYYGYSPDYVQNIALGIEFIHSYSLVHDDLPSMDNDSFRRGMPTTHIKFGEAMAILAGDALLNLGFECLLQGSEIADLNSARYIAKNSGVKGMVGGQCLDIVGENSQYNLEQIKELYNKKTSALFQSAIVASAIKCNATQSELTIWEQYSKNLGLIFQIVDDILDETATSEQLGKTVGKDKEQNKNTYVKAVGMSKARQHVQEIQDDIIHNIIPKLCNDKTLKNFCVFLTDRLS